jgi:gliding motility-associated-like protein
LYVADNVSGLIRKITPNGVVTTIAGNNIYFTDVDGLGTAASFIAPFGITIDSKNNLYVVDQGSSRIRKIASNGLVTTIAGSSPGYADGNGAGAHFNGPSCIAIDAAGNLFVCDDYNRKIRKIAPNGDVTTIAGSAAPGSFDGKGTSAGFAGVVGIVADKNNNLYVTESGIVSKIRKITPQGVVITLAGTGVPGFLDGFAANTMFNYPACLVIDATGNLYIADDANNRIRKITPQGVVSTFAGTGNAVDKDGNVVAPSTGNIAQLQIPVTVESSAAVVNNLKNSYNIISGSCIAVMPDYTSFIKATDNCTGADIPFTQSPLPGTSLTAGVPVSVTISTTRALLHMLSVAFTVTATAPQTTPPTVTILASADSVCKGTPVTFNARVVNGSTTLSYQWLINGINAGSNSPSFTTDVLNDKDVINCAVISGAGCVVPVLGSGFTMKVNPVPVIAFNQNPVISGGSGIRLEPIITGGNIAGYSWSPSTELDDATQKYPVASPANTTTYRLHVISTGGCDAVAAVTVTVVKPIVIPNAFTPNGDGINDLWNIGYLNDYTNCTVDVFNRYGQLIFHSIGYGKPWNGTNNGGQLPSGVYYYVIDLKNGTKKLSGEVTIIK